jgi:putative phage-type endonuclease
MKNTTVCNFIDESNLQQGSPEWHEFRVKGLGASDANKLTGDSKWDTVVDLWKNKTGRETTPFIVTPAIQHGIDTEPEARQMFELATDIKMSPVCAMSSEYNFIRASLDGMNDEKNLVLEIKCPSALGIHMKTMKGIVPSYYYPQLQHQLFVTKAKLACFWSYVKSMGGFLVEVEPNIPYIQELVRREKMFWDCVKNDIEPISTDYPPMIP